jgi:hypothetical protein
MRIQRIVAFSVITLGALAFAPAALALPTCSQLATDPANGLAGNPIVLSPTSTLVPASGPNPGYCRVDFILSKLLSKDIAQLPELSAANWSDFA